MNTKTSRGKTLRPTQSTGSTIQTVQVHESHSVMLSICSQGGQFHNHASEQCLRTNTHQEHLRPTLAKKRRQHNVNHQLKASHMSELERFPVMSFSSRSYPIKSILPHALGISTYSDANAPHTIILPTQVPSSSAHMVRLHSSLLQTEQHLAEKFSQRSFPPKFSQGQGLSTSLFAILYS